MPNADTTAATARARTDKYAILEKIMSKLPGQQIQHTATLGPGGA
jgi:hypothetical protein